MTSHPTKVPKDRIIHDEIATGLLRLSSEGANLLKDFSHRQRAFVMIRDEIKAVGFSKRKLTVLGSRVSLREVKGAGKVATTLPFCKVDLKHYSHA